MANIFRLDGIFRIEPFRIDFLAKLESFRMESFSSRKATELFML
jgi:hypothetical protein